MNNSMIRVDETACSYLELFANSLVHHHLELNDKNSYNRIAPMCSYTVRQKIEWSKISISSSITFPLFPNEY